MRTPRAARSASVRPRRTRAPQPPAQLRRYRARDDARSAQAAPARDVRQQSPAPPARRESQRARRPSPAIVTPRTPRPPRLLRVAAYSFHVTEGKHAIAAAEAEG